MATIAINELRPAGYDFFSDSESFLGDLSEQELNNVNGGTSPVFSAIIETAAYSSWQCGAAISGAVTIVGSLIYKAVS
jgi:lactobin A/cerein 7B family class IIb bacteriocin